MLSGPTRLALEVKYLDRATRFYRTHLDLPLVRETEREVTLAAGDDRLHLRAPGDVPRGGVHTHFALSTPADRYADWYDDLSAAFDLTEFDFGGAKSLYFDDPDDHCVEIGQRDGSDGGRGEDQDDLTGIFEIVLEVEDLERAAEFYTTLGASVVDRGDDRRRVRLDAGPVAFELWEPQLGIADARGGLHVDVTLRADDPSERAARVADWTCAVEEFDEGGASGSSATGGSSERCSDGVRIRDPDGHYLTLLAE